MHELSIAQSIIDVVTACAKERQAVRVQHVRILVGEASGVMAASLIFSFEMLASLDPVLDGAQLLIDSIPHIAYCHTCNKEFPAINFVPQCPDCQQWSSDIVSGTELQIVEMEIETAATVTPFQLTGPQASSRGTPSEALLVGIRDLDALER